VLCEVSAQRYLILNIGGALVWALVVGVLDYVFGHAFLFLIGKFKHTEAERLLDYNKLEKQ